MLRTSFICGALILLFSCGTDKNVPTIIIHDEVLNPVDDHLFGHFMEKCSWGGEIGGDLVIDPETGSYDSLVLEQLKMLNIPNLRYPGGTDVDYYDWTDLIDHAPGQNQRQPYRQYRQGPGAPVVSDNRLGLDEFLQLCEILEAEPIIVVNIGDAYHGKRTIVEAKASAADLFAYCNAKAGHGNPWADYRARNGRKKPYGVKIFELGNEYWGFDGFRWKTEYTESHIERLYACIEGVTDTLLSLEKDLVIIADGALPELNDKFSSRMKEKIDYLVFHPYRPWAMRSIFTSDSLAVSYDTITSRQVWDAWVTTPAIDPATGSATIFNDRWTDAVLETDFPIAATEWNWNGWFEGEPRDAGLTESDLAKGIGAAGFLHGLMRMGDRVEIACQSMTVGKSWGITGIRMDPEYAQPSVLLPTAQVTGLYSAYHGNDLLKTESHNIPFYMQPLSMGLIKSSENVACLDILSTRSENKLYLHVVNRSYDAHHRLKVMTDGISISESYQRHTLAGDKTAEIDNDSLRQAAEIETVRFRLNRRKSLEIPAASVSVFEFTLVY